MDVLEVALRKVAEQNGYTVDFVMVEHEKGLLIDSGESFFTQLAKKHSYDAFDCIVLDPIVSSLALSLELPCEDERAMVFLSNPVGEARGESCTYVRFNRSEAYVNVGRIVGNLLLLHNRGKQSLSNNGSTAGRAEIKTGIITFGSTTERREESESFRKGFLSVADPQMLIERRLPNVRNRAMVKNLLQELKDNGVSFFFLHTLTLTSYCLDFLIKEGGYAIVEDWDPSFGYEDVVICSVRENIPETYAKILARLKSNHGELLDGVVEIVWGKALSIPDDILQ